MIRDYGEFLGFKITRYEDRFEAVPARGVEVFQVPCKPEDKLFPALNDLLNKIKAAK
jgi:hypothetical protein